MCRETRPTCPTCGTSKDERGNCANKDCVEYMSPEALAAFRAEFGIEREA